MIPLPDKPLYWAEFANNQTPTTVSIIACWGWMLVTNEYEQQLYHAARLIMHYIVDGSIPYEIADYVYSFRHGTDIWWVSQEDSEQKFCLTS